MHPSSIFILSLSALAHGHGVILAAQGAKGSVASQGFLVNTTLARNCTDISPCQQDSTIIRDSEIKQNIVNNCGRTELAGNIDIGEQTENELAAKRVTSVTAGSTMQVTIHQVNADGAGPYECDIDQTSNAGQNITALKVTNNVPGQNGLSSAKFTDFKINVQLPQDMNCIGASTGNICTVRCRNNALAGPFGGCFAVMQTDSAGRGNTNASEITTSQTASDIAAQILVNNQQLGAEIQANQNAGATGANAGLEAVDAAGVDTNATQAGNQNANQGTGNAATANGNTGASGKKAGTGAAAAAAGNGNAANANAGNAAKGNGNAAAANGNAATANGNAAKGNGNAAAANGNAATANGNAAAANGNAATANGNAAAANGNAAAAKANGKNAGNAANAAAAAGGNKGGANGKNNRFVVRAKADAPSPVKREIRFAA